MFTEQIISRDGVELVLCEWDEHLVECPECKRQFLIEPDHKWLSYCSAKCYENSIPF